MTEIAQRQLGYTESAKNFTVDKALGETLAQAHHYTRYGDWYGNPYGSWDVMFVAFCQHYAGIPGVPTLPQPVQTRKVTSFFIPWPGLA